MFWCGLYIRFLSIIQHFWMQIWHVTYIVAGKSSHLLIRAGTECVISHACHFSLLHFYWFNYLNIISKEYTWPTIHKFFYPRVTSFLLSPDICFLFSDTFSIHSFINVHITPIKNTQYCFGFEERILVLVFLDTKGNILSFCSP